MVILQKKTAKPKKSFAVKIVDMKKTPTQLSMPEHSELSVRVLKKPPRPPVKLMVHVAMLSGSIDEAVQRTLVRKTEDLVELGLMESV